jgi:hypothetical protein
MMNRARLITILALIAWVPILAFAATILWLLA